MINILTVDVEDYYMDTDISTWHNYEDRIVPNTIRILDLLKKYDVKATFFVLGYVAETHPELVSAIYKDGHEIGTHGYRHKPITAQTPEEFESDLIRSIASLEKITGERVYGHRACQFSITKKNPWAIDILKKAGLKYDSSVFPVKTPLYGVPGAPLSPYPISSDNISSPADGDFLEYPLSVFKWINLPFPVAGGFYLRFFPYWFTNLAIKKINDKGRRAIVYIHPWEIDPSFPYIKEFSWYHYYNLNKTFSRLEKLLNDFDFTDVI